MAKKSTKQTATIQKTAFTGVDYFEKLGNRCQWIVLALLIIMAVIVFRDFLFFENVFLYKDIASDSLNLSYPFLCHNVHYFQHYGFPSWSFQFGMGENAFTLALSDPLDYLLYPLGIEKMRNLLGYKVAVEIVVAGFAFYHYLRFIKLTQFVCITGALMYGFSGFMIVSSCWFIFAVEVLAMPFILLGIEMIYRQNQYWLLPLPIFYVTLSRPFVLATLAVFLLLYCTMRLMQEERFRLKAYSLLLVKAGLVSLAGILMAAPWLLEHLQIMLQSPRGSGANALGPMLKATPVFSVSDKLQLSTAVCRTFASDILGSGNDFKGWQNILEAPAFYCGIVALLLIPQLFCYTTRRQKLLYGIFLLIWLLPAVFPYFRYAFSFFTGDYYRSYSFYVGLVFTVLAVFALDKIMRTKKVNLIVLGVTVVVLMILLFYPWFEEDVLVKRISNFAVFAILLYAAWLAYSRRMSKIFQFFFIGFLVTELVYFSSVSVNNRDILSMAEANDKAGYNDYSNEAIAFIKKRDTGFYRIDKRYSSSPAMHLSLNDAMAQDYNGTSSYNSFNQEYYIRFLKALSVIVGNDEAPTRWAAGLTNRFIQEGINDVKYVLTKNPVDPNTSMVFDSIGRFGDVTVLQHKYALPIGFVYDKIFRLDDYMACSSTQKDFMSLRSAVVASPVFDTLKNIQKLRITDTLAASSFSFDRIKTSTDTLSQAVFHLTQFEPTLIQGEIRLQHAGLLYFSIPYDGDWKISDGNNKVYDKIILTDGMTGVYLEPGSHKLQLLYRSRLLPTAQKLSVAGLLLFLLIVFLSWKSRRRRDGAPASTNE